MAYRLGGGESVADDVRRVAVEQIDRAVSAVSGAGEDPGEAIHDARKVCKKLRGLLRLVRPHLGKTYKLENAHYRDAARSLSALRDAEVLVDTYDALVNGFGDQLEEPAFQTIRDQLVERRTVVAREHVDLDGRLNAFVETMTAGRDRVASWPLDATGFALVREGFQRTYARGRDALKAAYKHPTGDNFHEWRKRAKYHWYHVRLLQNVWPLMLKPRRKGLKTLSDLLGDDHDLMILRSAILDAPETFGDERTILAFIGMVDTRQAELRAKAGPLGRRLYADKPNTLTRRMGMYWDAWRKSTNGHLDAARSAPAAFHQN